MEKNFASKKLLCFALLLIMALSLVFPISFVAYAEEEDPAKITDFASLMTLDGVTATNAKDNTGIIHDTTAFGNRSLNLETENTGSGANGSSATFLAAFGGDIEFNFGIKGKAGGTDATAYTFRKLIFRFFDAANPTDYFDFVIHNKHAWLPAPSIFPNTYNANTIQGAFSYISYNGVILPPAGGSMNEDGMVQDVPFGGTMQGSFLGADLVKADMKFRWKAETGEIIVEDGGGKFSSVVMNLKESDYGKPFSGFNSYGVSVIFDEIEDGEKASVSISRIVSEHGEMLTNADGTKTAGHKPMLTRTGDAGVLLPNTTYTLPKIEARDFETGYFTAEPGDENLTLYYKKSGGPNVDITSKTITVPNEPGDYGIYATITDTQGDVSDETVIAEFTAAPEVPLLVIDEKIADYFLLGKEVALPAGSVTYQGQTKAAEKIFITGPTGSVYAEGVDVTAAPKFTPDKNGAYTIQYTGVLDYAHTFGKNTNVASYGVYAGSYLSESFFKAGTGVDVSHSYAEPLKVNAGTGMAFRATESGALFRIQAGFTADAEIKYSFLPDGENKNYVEADKAMNRFIFRFSDENDAANYFDVVFQDHATSGYTKAYVVYNGERRSANKDTHAVVKDDAIMETDLVGYQNGYMKWQWSLIDRPGILIFDSETLEIKVDFNGTIYTVADLNSDDFLWTKKFGGFEGRYNVTGIFDDVIASKTATALIYSVNGISTSKYTAGVLNGETVESLTLESTALMLVGPEEVTIEAQPQYQDAGAVIVYRYEGFDNLHIYAGTAEAISTVISNKPGSYTVTYSGAGAEELVRTVKVVDTTDPTVKLKNVPYEGNRMSAIDLPEAEVSDNSSDAVTVTITFTGPEDISGTVDNYRFTPEKEGTYVITYTATDGSGRTGTVRFEVAVGPEKEGCSGFSATAVGWTGTLASVLFGFAVMCLLRRRKSATEKTGGIRK